MTEPLISVVDSSSHPVAWNEQLDTDDEEANNNHTGSYGFSPPDEVDCDCSTERICTILPRTTRTNCHIIFLLLCVLVSVAMMTVGIVYREACQLEPGIAVYLIICGALFLLKTFLHVLLFVKRRKHPELYEGHALVRLDSVISCFLICCIVVGSTWIFSLFGKMMSRDSHIHQFCDKTFYTMVFCMQTAICTSGLLAFAILCPIYVRSCGKR